MSKTNIITRFAPSPTGFLHLGNYRTAVFAYLFARQNNGKFIVRIEDTDRERSKKEYEENILESLNWLGLKYDEFYKQSDNISSHTRALQKLINDDKAYLSKEEAKDGSGTIRELVRFRNPNKVVAFDDVIRGRIETDTTDLGDFVIAKSLTEPLFHLAVVVDDFEEGITHVIRGEDHIPNTPRQMLIQEALGFYHPTYAHLPLVLSPDRTKLSKRKGALPVTNYRDQGYLPQALLNFMAFIGWNPGTEKEIYNISDLINDFDMSKIQKSGAVFNEEKLKWINKEHIRLQDRTEQFSCLKKYMDEYGDSLITKLQDIIIERISSYGELLNIKDEEFSFFLNAPNPLKDKLIWKNSDIENTIKSLEVVKETISNSPYSTIDELKNLIMPIAESRGKGNVLWPLRVALSGKDKSIDPFTICNVLEKEEVIIRIDTAIKILKDESP